MKVGLIGGDGIGPDVVAVGEQVLRALRERHGRDLELVSFDLCADRYLRTGETFPEDEAQRLRACDAVLLGALGDPRVPDHRHAADILFGMRFGFDLYANVRPVKCLHPNLSPLRDGKSADFVVFRENTEGLYTRVGGNVHPGGAHEVAINQAVYTRRGVERVVRAAFAFADRRGRERVMLADKHNAMPESHGLWKRVFDEVAADYGSIEASHRFVDALCHDLVQDPGAHDVIVTCNLFGDIITDLGAALQGGMGMAASANLHPVLEHGVTRSGAVGEEAARRGPPLFEPVHGSAPDLVGQDRANPFATVLSVGMMMRELGYAEDEARLTDIVRRGVATGNCTADVGGKLGTRAAGEFVVAELLGHAP